MCFPSFFMSLSPVCDKNCSITDGSLLPVQLAIRRDEANHRDVNHTFAELSADETNPYVLKHAADVKKAETNQVPTS